MAALSGEAFVQQTNDRLQHVGIRGPSILQTPDTFDRVQPMINVHTGLLRVEEETGILHLQGLGDGGVLGEAGGGEQNAQALHLHRWQFTSGEFAMEHHAKQASWSMSCGKKLLHGLGR